MATAPWPECAAASLQRCLGMMSASAFDAVRHLVSSLGQNLLTLILTRSLPQSQVVRLLPLLFFKLLCT